MRCSAGPRLAAPSGQDLHRGVEAYLARGATRPDRALPRSRRRAAIGAHPGEVQGNGAFDAPERGIDRLPGRHAAREVGNVRTKP